MSDSDYVEMEINGNNGQGPVIEMSKEQYAEITLPGMFQNAWDDPDELANVILLTLRDGLPKHCIEPCKRLFAIDTQAGRASYFYGMALMESGELDQAEEIFQKGIHESPDSLALKFGLAQVLKQKDQMDAALELLNVCVGKDATNADYLKVWAPLYLQKYGQQEFERQLNVIVQGTNHYNPMFQLAQHYIATKEYARAVEVIVRMLPLTPIDVVLIADLVGQLGKHEQRELIVNEIAPLYNPASHNIGIGLNILEAYSRNGNYSAGLQLLNQIRSGSSAADSYCESLDSYQHKFES